MSLRRSLRREFHIVQQVQHRPHRLGTRVFREQPRRQLKQQIHVMRKRVVRPRPFSLPPHQRHVSLGRRHSTSHGQRAPELGVRLLALRTLRLLRLQRSSERGLRSGVQLGESTADVLRAGR